MAHGCEARRQDPSAVERRIGKLLGRNTCAAGMFDVKVTGTKKTGARVTWARKPEWREWASLSEGCYLLRTNVTDWQPDDLWRAYIQLAEAENAFRIQKTELRIRPIWHQLENRVQAHILFSFLAYAMPGAELARLWSGAMRRVEDARDMDGTCRARARGPNGDPGTRTHTRSRRRPANVPRPARPCRVRHTPHARTADTARPPWHRVAGTTRPTSMDTGTRRSRYGM